MKEVLKVEYSKEVNSIVSRVVKSLEMIFKNQDFLIDKSGSMIIIYKK